MRNLRAIIEQCLKEDEASRNSDIRLTNYLWIKHYGGRLFKDNDGKWSVRLIDIYGLPREDDVKRIRALFNNKGMYLPTDPEVIKQRRLNELQWRKELGYTRESIQPELC